VAGIAGSTAIVNTLARTSQPAALQPMTSVVITAGAIICAVACPVAKTPWYWAGASAGMRSTDRRQEAATNSSSPAT